MSKGSSPSQSTQYTSNIPEYARPYVMNMLGAAQNELFNTTTDAEGNKQITGFKAYQPFSTNPQDYFAQPTALQGQVYGEAAGLKTPGQFSQATGYANQAAQGGLDSVGRAYGYGQEGFQSGRLGQGLGIQGGQYYGNMGAQSGMLGQNIGIAGGDYYGNMGAGYGQQAAGLANPALGYGQQGAGYGQQGADIGLMGLRAEQTGNQIGRQAQDYARQAAAAGQNYAAQATNPLATQAYMSPYMQNVVDTQKAAAVRDYQMAMPQLTAQAAKAGAFGGSRDAIQRSEAARNLTSQLQNIQAQGQQQAFQNAQAQQQFGANLGLQGLAGAQQGLGTALQGGQLGLSGIGTALQGMQTGIQGAGMGLQGVGAANQAYQTGIQGAGMGLQGVDRQLAGTAQGMQGAQVGLSGVDRQLAGTAQGMQGAQVGLQGVSGAQAGYGLANQAASNLANIGSAQQQADLSRLGFQNQLGQQQQAYQQQLINQQIQDYATAQQYPLMQLSSMSNLLRGLPMQSTTTQSYMPTPSLGTQAISGLGTLYGVGKGTGLFRKGGAVKSMASGGVTRYANQGQVTDVESSMKAKLESLASTPAGLAQVARIAETSPSLEQRKLANIVLREHQDEQQAAQQAQASIDADQAKGIAAAPAPAMDAIGAATGGIVAFAGDEGSDVYYDPNKAYANPYEVLSDAAAIKREQERRKILGIGEVMLPEYKEYLAKQKTDLPGLRERATGWDIADIFGNMYQSALERPGQGILGQLTSGAAKASPNIRSRQNELRGIEKDIATSGQDVYGKERADQLAILTGTEKERKEALDRIEKRDVARIAADRATDLDRTTAVIKADLLAGGAPNDASTAAKARRMAIEQTGLAYQKMDLASGDKMYRALKDDKEIKSLRRQQMQYEEGSKEYNSLEDKISNREQQIRSDFSAGQSTSGGTPGANAPKAGDKTDTGSGRFPKPEISSVSGAPEGSTIGAKTAKGWEVKDKNGKVIGYAQR